MKYTLKLHAIPLSDDDGGRGFDFTAADLKNLVERTNKRYAKADIAFEFDPATDWQPRKSTALNNMRTGSSWWKGGNAIAAKIPGKVVVFFRHGPKASPTGNGHAYPPATGASVPKSAPLPTANVAYVAMPNTKAGINQSDSFFSHELGHYLGLFHTFPGWGNDTIYGDDPDSLTDQQAIAKLVRYIRKHGGTIAALDGDLMSDTAPDPGSKLYKALGWDRCDPTKGTFNLKGNLDGKPYNFTFTPPRSNIMTYGACGALPGFTPKQIARIHKTLQHPSRRMLIVPPCSPDFHDLPANQFQTCFDYWVHRGLWPVTLSATRIGPKTLIAGSFQKGKSRPVRSLVTGTMYQAAFTTFRNEGFRPGRMSATRTSAGTRFTAIWTPIDGEFEARHSLTLGAFAVMWKSMRQQSFLNTDLFIYPTGSGLRVASVWVKQPFEDYATYYDMTSAQYNKRFKEFWAKGLRVTCFVAYPVSSGYRYAAIWEKVAGDWAHYYGMTSAQYQKRYGELAKKGLRLHQVQAYGTRYSAIWTKP